MQKGHFCPEAETMGPNYSKHAGSLEDIVTQHCQQHLFGADNAILP